MKLLLATATILIASAFAQSLSWKVNGGYSVKAGMLVFKGLKASIVFDETHPEKSKISASIDATTIDTGNELMNAHAKEKEALYTAKYPVITFVSTTIKKTGPGSRYEATGNLTLKGVTKEIKLPFTFDSKKNVMDRFPMVTKETFYGSFTIDPKDFGITRAGTPEQIIVELNLPVTQ